MKNFLTIITFLFCLFFLAGTTSLVSANEVDGQATPPSDIEINALNITSSFSKTMLTNAAYMSQYALYDKQKGTYPVLTGLKFAERVKSGSIWDYKKSFGVKTVYFYNGKYLTGEDLGNMHYGFVGRGAFFSRTLLSSAAGAYQIYSGTYHLKWWATYFDDPKDQAMIKYGMDFWDNANLPKTNLDPNTSLNDELTFEEKSVIEKEFLEDYKEYLAQQQEE